MIELLNSRRSIRKFKSDAVSEKDLQDVLEAAMNAPSAINEQAWQFIILSGSVLEEFLKINTNTPKSAPTGILVCQDLRSEKAKGYAVQDCSAATQNILLAIHGKGLGGVWTTVFPQNIQRIKALLNIPDAVQPFSFVPVGYPVDKPTKPESRYDAKKVHRNRW
ncbi:MAG TPA: nitroreductase family protein [Nitrospirota bacterium]|nr:nitroreductase family protein [Nitrospirota bacterium]